MPYVLRDGSGDVETVLLNPIDENTEFLADGHDDITWFNLKLSTLRDLYTELGSRDETVVIDAITWDLSGKFANSFMIALMNAYEDAAANVDLPDSTGSLNNYLIANAKTLSNQISDYRKDLYANFNSLKASIDAATTLAAIQAVDVTAGWPVAP